MPQFQSRTHVKIDCFQVPANSKTGVITEYDEQTSMSGVLIAGKSRSQALADPTIFKTSPATCKKTRPVVVVLSEDQQRSETTTKHQYEYQIHQ